MYCAGENRFYVPSIKFPGEKVWYYRHDIKDQIPEPLPVTSSGRHFCVLPDIWAKHKRSTWGILRCCMRWAQWDVIILYLKAFQIISTLMCTFFMNLMFHRCVMRWIDNFFVYTSLFNIYLHWCLLFHEFNVFLVCVEMLYWWFCM